MTAAERDAKTVAALRQLTTLAVGSINVDMGSPNSITAVDDMLVCLLPHLNSAVRALQWQQIVHATVALDQWETGTLSTCRVLHPHNPAGPHADDSDERALVLLKARVRKALEAAVRADRVVAAHPTVIRTGQVSA